MIIKKINKWNYVSQMENLLFFANLIDEMTFNYTLDSFKASVHNIFSLMRECLITIKDIQTETIKKGAHCTFLCPPRGSNSRPTD